MNTQLEILTPKFPHILHGGDYNPDQWLDQPEKLSEDILFMKKANINCVSLGIFAWSKIEPRKDVFKLDWLEEIINKLYSEGIYVILATPSGARPRWLALESEEVLRVDDRGKRAHFGGRHNHCMTSPVYRERVAKVDGELARRFGKHPAVIMWHISNEYEGECHCQLCQKEFRNYIKRKYKNIDNLNRAWWTSFWSHDYSDFDEIEAPSSIGENSINGLTLDWKRYVTYQTADFMKNEIEAVRKYAPEIPVTTNMMGLSDVLSYPVLSSDVDIISWDSYPNWHEPGQNIYQGIIESFTHDYMRCLKMRPFILMESTVSTVNWRPISKAKKPGMHKLSMINAIGHGAQSAMYFQIRQALGGPEKFHSAVISHSNSSNTRTFMEVSELGKELGSLSEFVYNSHICADVAIIYDKENKWALDNSCGPRNAGLDYDSVCVSYYEYFWKNGINVDVIDSRANLDNYKIVVTPMLYMYHYNIQDKIRKFVKQGGYVVSSALSGYVDDSDLCFIGESSDEKLSDVYGIWIEEMDALYDEEYNQTFFGGEHFKLKSICEIVNCIEAKPLCVYENDFYKGKPVITENIFGAGKAYHIAANPEQGLCSAILERIVKEAGVSGVLDGVNIPDGIGIASRTDGDKNYIFIGNFSDEGKEIWVDKCKKAYHYIDGTPVDDTIKLEAYGAVCIMSMVNN